MKCPFRTEKRYLCQVYRASDFMGASNPHYAWVPCTARDAKRITDEFADCIEENCQAYIGHGKCARLCEEQTKGAAAIAQIKAQKKPLTIEQILNMNGKPVWYQTGDGYEGWALVIIDKYKDGGHYLYLFSDDLTRDGINEAFEPDEDFINLKFSDDPNGHFGLHVLGWRAYRYEPKGAHQ